MLRKLFETNIAVSDEEFVRVMEMTTEDIKYNRMNFNKKTTINDIINIARSSLIAIRRCD